MKKYHLDHNESNSNLLESKIRPLHFNEEKELLDFYKELHPNGDKILTFWQWRQKINLTKGIETDYIVKTDKKIVGAMGLNPVETTYNGNTFLTFWHRDTLISPVMRGKGLVKQLLKHTSEHWDLVLAKGSNNIMYKIRKAFGWKDVQNSDYLMHVLNPFKTGNTIIKNIIYFVLFLWSKTLSSLVFGSNLVCMKIDRFGTDFDDLADSVSGTNELKLYKSSHYLNWRYFHCPDREYTVIRCGDNKLSGAIVLRLPKENNSEAWIIDCICDSSDVKCIKALLKAAFQYFKQNKVGRILVFCTSPEIRNILFQFGFVSIKRSPKFTYIIKQDHPIYNNISDMKWNFWHGDSDNELYE